MLNAECRKVLGIFHLGVYSMKAAPTENQSRTRVSAEPAAPIARVRTRIAASLKSNVSSHITQRPLTRRSRHDEGCSWHLHCLAAGRHFGRIATGGEMVR
jgi:hypothetical protein